MSLLGNRGRFSREENCFFNGDNSEFNSVISSIGKNPTKLFNITPINLKEDLKDKIKKHGLNSYAEPFSSHKEYNDKLKNIDSIINNSVLSNKKKIIDAEKPKFKLTPKIIIFMVILEIITLVGIYMIGSVYRFSNMTQTVPFNINNVQNTEITESTLAIMRGYKTVAIFGVDSRTGSVDKGNNADVNLIVNLNLETGDVQLVSVYRDLYLSVTDNNLYDKLNAAYRRGGPEQAVKALNKNFDLNIDSYFAFNWKAVATGVELLGGIDIEITKSEYRYMNAFIHETCIATGIDAKNPAAHYIKSSGMQHLDGVQAVAYGRLRLMDSDFQRVERQKKVIALCLEKAKQLDIPRIRLIMEAVLPQIAYAFDMNEMLSIIKIIRTINITESTSCPEVNNVMTLDMGQSGDSVVPINLEKAVIKLHKTLFGVDDYKPSTAVKRYSNRISELKNQYIEERRTHESLKQESISNSATVSSSSNGTKTNNKGKVSVASQSNTDVVETSISFNDLPVIDAVIDYPEEPESDESAPMNNAIKVDAPSTPKINNEYPGNVDNSTQNLGPNNDISNTGVVVDGPPTGTLETTIDFPKVPDNSIIEPVFMPY